MATYNATSEKITLPTQYPEDVANGTAPSAIPCILTKPDTDHCPAVILVSGGASSMDEVGGYYRQMAAELAGRGIASIRFDVAGNGERALEPIRYAHQDVEDIEAVYGLLRADPQIDSASISIHGYSLGGMSAAEFVLRHPDDIKLLTMQGPSLYWNHDLGEIETNGGRLPNYNFGVKPDGTFNVYMTYQTDAWESMKARTEIEPGKTSRLAADLQGFPGKIEVFCGAEDDTVNKEQLVRDFGDSVHELPGDHTMNLFREDPPADPAAVMSAWIDAIVSEEVQTATQDAVATEGAQREEAVSMVSHQKKTKESNTGKESFMAQKTEIDHESEKKVLTILYIDHFTEYEIPDLQSEADYDYEQQIQLLELREPEEYTEADKIQALGNLKTDTAILNFRKGEAGKDSAALWRSLDRWEKLEVTSMYGDYVRDDVSIQDVMHMAKEHGCHTIVDQLEHILTLKDPESEDGKALCSKDTPIRVSMRMDTNLEPMLNTVTFPQKDTTGDLPFSPAVKTDYAFQFSDKTLHVTKAVNGFLGAFEKEYDVKATGEDWDSLQMPDCMENDHLGTDAYMQELGIDDGIWKDEAAAMQSPALQEKLEEIRTETKQALIEHGLDVDGYAYRDPDGRDMEVVLQPIFDEIQNDAQVLMDSPQEPAVTQTDGVPTDVRTDMEPDVSIDTDSDVDAGDLDDFDDDME